MPPFLYKPTTIIIHGMTVYLWQPMVAENKNATLEHLILVQKYLKKKSCVCCNSILCCHKTKFLKKYLLTLPPFLDLYMC